MLGGGTRRLGVTAESVRPGARGTCLKESEREARRGRRAAGSRGRGMGMGAAGRPSMPPTCVWLTRSCQSCRSLSCACVKCGASSTRARSEQRRILNPLIARFAREYLMPNIQRFLCEPSDILAAHHGNVEHAVSFCLRSIRFLFRAVVAC